MRIEYTDLGNLFTGRWKKINGIFYTFIPRWDWNVESIDSILKVLATVYPFIAVFVYGCSANICEHIIPSKH